MHLQDKQQQQRRTLSLQDKQGTTDYSQARRTRRLMVVPKMTKPIPCPLLKC
jgi:hypothetical protein